MSTKGKIYVADPDVGVIRLIRGALEPAGYTVQEAFEWDQLIEEMAVFGPDVAFLATDIPDRYYGDIIGEARRSDDLGAVPMIVMVPPDDRRAVGDSLAQGAADVLYKPLVLADVLNKIKLHTSRQQPLTTDLDLDLDDDLLGSGGDRIPLNDLKTGSEVYDRDLSTFIEVTEAISSSLEPEDAFFVLVRRLADAIPCDRCNIVLTGVGDDEAWVVASHDEPNLKRHEISLHNYPEYRQSLESMEPVLIDDAQTHPVTERVRDEVGKVELGSTLVFPLIVRETAMGVLSLQTRGAARDFTAAELLLLRAMANLAACVIKATTALESVRYQSVSEKAPAEEFENIVLDLDDQIEVLMDELGGE